MALSTTSVAVVYAVMLELGFNQTQYGKAILAALGTVIALGLMHLLFADDVDRPHLLPEKQKEPKESVYGEPVGNLDA